MLKVELNKKSENPFYGMKGCLQIYQNASKGMVNPTMLDHAWLEAKNDIEKRKMFFSLLFSIGDRLYDVSLLSNK
jgi:hypothetical protein